MMELRYMGIIKWFFFLIVLLRICLIDVNNFGLI